MRFSHNRDRVMRGTWKGSHEKKKREESNGISGQRWTLSGIDRNEDLQTVSGSYKHDSPCLLQMEWRTKTKIRPKKQNATVSKMETQLILLLFRHEAMTSMLMMFDGGSVARTEGVCHFNELQGVDQSVNRGTTWFKGGTGASQKMDGVYWAVTRWLRIKMDCSIPINSIPRCSAIAEGRQWRKKRNKRADLEGGTFSQKVERIKIGVHRDDKHWTTGQQHRRRRRHHRDIRHTLSTEHATYTQQASGHHTHASLLLQDLLFYV